MTTMNLNSVPTLAGPSAARHARPSRTGRAAATLAVAAMLAACSTSQQVKQIAQDGKDMEQQATAQARAVAESIARGTQTRLGNDEVERPYLAGKPVPLAPGVNLPPALRAGVNTTMLFRQGKIDLVTFAEGVTDATGIPVRVKPDAMLPLSSFLPRVGGAAKQDVGTTLEANTLFEVKAEEVPLNRLLDRVAARLSVNWKYNNGAIEIFRLESRVFDYRALPVKVTSAAGLGRNAGTNSAFDNTSNTKYAASETDPIASARAAIEARMTRAGLGPVISPETGTVVVTDTPQALALIGELIERENKLLTRRVDLVFEAIDVRLSDNGEVGVDLSAIVSKVTSAVADRSLTFTTGSPLSLTGLNAGSIGLTRVGGSADGSSIVAQALSEVGTIINTTRVPIQTINRRPASYAIRSTFNYIDQVTGAGAAGVGATSTGATVTQKDETVGTVLTVVPDVSDNGLVSMAISYDNTVKSKLEPLTVGAGSSEVTVQQKVIDGTGMIQQVITRSGVPTVIGGIEHDVQEGQSRRLDKAALMLFGGSDLAKTSRVITVLSVTAIAKDGI